MKKDVEEIIEIEENTSKFQSLMSCTLVLFIMTVISSIKLIEIFNDNNTIKYQIWWFSGVLIVILLAALFFTIFSFLPRRRYRERLLLKTTVWLLIAFLIVLFGSIITIMVQVL